MKFHRLKDVSVPPTDLVCRQSSWSIGVATLTFIAIGVGLLFIPDFVFRYISAPVVFLMALVFAGSLRKAMSPQNWLLRINLRGIWVKFRSFENAKFSTSDEVVVSFEPHEIAWVGSTGQRLISPGSDSGVKQESIKYLEIGLRDVDFAELERRLAKTKPPATSGPDSDQNL